MEQISSQTELLALVLFILAIVHTFSVKFFLHWAKKFKEGSVGENLFHLLGEVEIVFGIWSFLFFVGASFTESFDFSLKYLDSRNFTEPLFVFAVMVVASTRPIIDLATRLINALARHLPLPRGIGFFMACLVLGPLLGSFITEPAAMTVTAVILLETVFGATISTPFKYAVLGLLFVNVSIGGTLTHFAAPPVVMVARLWGWDTPFMVEHFGVKALIAILLSTSLVAMKFRKELTSAVTQNQQQRPPSPLAMSLLHVFFLTVIVLSAHHPQIFISVFLFFLGCANVTKEYQSPLKIKEGLLVGFFLAGLITLGGVQAWWIAPLIQKLDSLSLFIGSSALTTIFDNAALTYLGTLVPNISAASQYALVAGAVVGGGMTVIANAPNPIGYGLLSSQFGDEGISPALLFKAAVIPTLIAGLCFWIL